LPEQDLKRLHRRSGGLLTDGVKEVLPYLPDVVCRGGLLPGA
jgi:hypothetical protein